MKELFTVECWRCMIPLVITALQDMGIRLMSARVGEKLWFGTCLAEPSDIEAAKHLLETTYPGVWVVLPD